LPYATEEWKTIRQALEKMPQNVIVELCKMQHGERKENVFVWSSREGARLACLDQIPALPVVNVQPTR
jgi:hypothetical protein